MQCFVVSIERADAEMAEAAQRPFQWPSMALPSQTPAARGKSGTRGRATKATTSRRPPRPRPQPSLTLAAESLQAGSYMGSFIESDDENGQPVSARPPARRKAPTRAGSQQGRKRGALTQRTLD